MTIRHRRGYCKHGVTLQVFCPSCASEGLLSKRDREKKPVSEEASSRKNRPLFSGVLAYFPDALLAVSEVSKAGNDQHNPGEPLHWARDKSSDHADSLARHLLDAGKVDTDGKLHSAKVAWRALALLQEELEANKQNNSPQDR